MTAQWSYSLVLFSVVVAVLGVATFVERRNAAQQQTLAIAGRLAADAARLPLAGASVDALLSNFALHWCPEPLPLMRELRRVVRADGLAQRLDALFQSRLFSICGQAFDQVSQYRAELLLLAVFALVDHLAVLHEHQVARLHVDGGAIGGQDGADHARDGGDGAVALGPVAFPAGLGHPGHGGVDLVTGGQIVGDERRIDRTGDERVAAPGAQRTRDRSDRADRACG